MLRIILIFLITAVFIPVYSAGYAFETSEAAQVFSKYKGQYIIVISKKDFTLSVIKRDLKVIKKYKIGYGLNADKKAKQYAGDNRTPEGVYRITEKLSMDADRKSEAYKKLESMNRVYFLAKEGHYKFGQRDQDLGTNAYGPRFFRIDYPNKSDLSRYEEACRNRNIPVRNGRMCSIGSGIAIHGTNDDPSIGQLSSSGCIRMHNADIVELDNYIQLDTPVIIGSSQ